MMNPLLRIACAVAQSPAGKPKLCCENLAQLLEEPALKQADLIVFPHLALAPPSSRSLQQTPAVAEACADCLEELLAATAQLPGCVLVGMLLMLGGTPCEVTAVIQAGKSIGILCPEGLATVPCASFQGWKLLPANTIFSCGELSFCVYTGATQNLPCVLPALAQSGCSTLVLQSYEPVNASSLQRTQRLLSALSENFGLAFVLCGGGIEASSSPFLYEGTAAIYENGVLLGSKQSGREAFSLVCDLDCDILNACRKSTKPCFPSFSFAPLAQKEGLLRPLSADPFLPADPAEAQAYLSRLFALQVQSLLARITDAGLHQLVLGVSGGLDSTLALLVCREALAQLELSPAHLLAVTMPGFGTSDRTYENALSLIKAIGCAHRDISIKASVLQHFEDIGHPPSLHDLTYENAQARERTQILFDLSNTCHGLVIGTGDLSEAALGWCTFNGDHMASYNVNICLTKGNIRKLVTQLSATMSGTIGEILSDIVATPVSPELLPPDSSGQIKQKTEEILGSYELHDFFLYHLIRYHFDPPKLLSYARAAFSGRFTQAEIDAALPIFLHRFYSSQFKRSCAPDAASITDVNLTPAD